MHDDYNRLLRPALERAFNALSEADSFAPFALVLGTDGAVREQVSFEHAPHAPYDDWIGYYLDGMAVEAQSGRICAAAVVYDVRITADDDHTQDAVCLHLDHAEGGPVDCYKLYRLEDSRVVGGELRLERGTVGFFG